MRKIFVFFLLAFFCLQCRNKDKKVFFSKIIYHTSGCFGYCPQYHLELDNNKQVKLFVEIAYKRDKKENRIYTADSSKMGYFIGIVNDSTFNEINNEIKTVNVDRLTSDKSLCCDGSLETMIIYYDGKRKFLQTMFPTSELSKLTSIFYSICSKNSFKRVAEKFNIETPKKD